MPKVSFTSIHDLRYARLEIRLDHRLLIAPQQQWLFSRTLCFPIYDKGSARPPYYIMQKKGKPSARNLRFTQVSFKKKSTPSSRSYMSQIVLQRTTVCKSTRYHNHAYAYTKIVAYIKALSLLFYKSFTSRYDCCTNLFYFLHHLGKTRCISPGSIEC